MVNFDEEDKKRVICSNPDCRVAETGRCVEGMELTICPHYGSKSEAYPEEYTDDAHEQDESTDVSTDIRLPSAETWTPSEVSRLLCERETRVIAIVGPSEAGKTSLIASLYDLYQLGPVLGTEFARSRTLHAFELTCHDARAVSRRNVPHTHRTNYGEVRFYHIELYSGPANSGLALVLGDRAGEEYRSAADDASLALTFPEIKRADSLTVLVDGQRLLDSGARHNLRSQIIMILQALIDTDSVQVGHRLALVLTKIDTVYESLHKERAEADFDFLTTSIKKHFGEVFEVIEQFRIAASPKTDAVPRGTGVPELLGFWLKPVRPAITTNLARPTFKRAFARLPINANIK